jgi:peptidyl-prolyl cis-trans isomerase A (cyclophilin A)
MSVIIVFDTSKGLFEVGLDDAKAPATAENFLSYVREGFYDDTVFHRVIGNFMVQGGGFGRDGRQKDTKAPIRLESANGLKNLRGAVAMARTSAPDSATSQFFINVVDNTMLDRSDGNAGYAVFGRVVSGMDVVDRIRSVRTGGRGIHQDWPLEDVVLGKAYVKG